MAYENDVRRKANSLCRVAGEARTEQRKVNAIIDNVNQWWRGEGSDAFNREYGSIDNDASRSLSKIEQAADNLYRLPNLIRRAERERWLANQKKT